MTYYRANTLFETMDTTEDGRILLDSTAGNVHMLDDIGNTIYTLLNDPLSLSDLIRKLCEIYDAPQEEIAMDVQDFLNDAAAKGILLTDEH